MYLDQTVWQHRSGTLYRSPNGEVVNWYKNTTAGTVTVYRAETVRVTILKDGVTTTIDYPYAVSE